MDNELDEARARIGRAESHRAGVRAHAHQIGDARGAAAAGVAEALVIFKPQGQGFNVGDVNARSGLLE